MQFIDGAMVGRKMCVVEMFAEVEKNVFSSKFTDEQKETEKLDDSVETILPKNSSNELVVHVFLLRPIGIIRIGGKFCLLGLLFITR